MTRRCIDRVYCLSDRAAIYAHMQKTLICMQVNYQEAANRQALVTSFQYSVFCFEFSVFSFSISFAQTLVLLFRHKDARTNGDTLEMGHDIPKESHMAQKDLFCFSLKYHTNH